MDLLRIPKRITGYEEKKIVGDMKRDGAGHWAEIRIYKTKREKTIQDKCYCFLEISCMCQPAGVSVRQCVCAHTYVDMCCCMSEYCYAFKFTNI